MKQILFSIVAFLCVMLSPLATEKAEARTVYPDVCGYIGNSKVKVKFNQDIFNSPRSLSGKYWYVGKGQKGTFTFKGPLGGDGNYTLAVYDYQGKMCGTIIITEYIMGAHQGTIDGVLVNGNGVRYSIDLSNRWEYNWPGVRW
ncbi:MAG: hypothetical protein K2H18_08175 [Muribaculaceae bacterium]|nr:hypothetical protein [Muribaculaceae bacterium]